MDFETLDLALETSGAKDCVGCVDWPEEFPYRPDCSFSMAYSKSHLAIRYHVRGLDLRAAALEDGGRVWEDSCCEFFVSSPSGDNYYNFELNCIGTLLNAEGASRHNRIRRSDEDLARVLRFSTLEHKAVEENDKVFCWNVAMLIPFDLMGIDPDCLPKSIRANLYKCGDKTGHPHFLSWAPIDTPSPDFHRPEFFGEIVLG